MHTWVVISDKTGRIMTKKVDRETADKIARIFGGMPVPAGDLPAPTTITGREPGLGAQ